MFGRILLGFLFLTVMPLTLLAVLLQGDAGRALNDAGYRSLTAAASQTKVAVDAFFSANRSIIAAEAKLPELAAFLYQRQSATAHTKGGTDADTSSDVARHIVADEDIEASVEPAIDLAMADRVHATLRVFARRDPVFIHSYALISADGDVVLSSRNQPTMAREDQLLHFRFALENGVASASPIQFLADSTSGAINAFFDISSPIVDDQGIPLGLLRVRFAAAVLQHLVGAGSGLVGVHSFAYVIDDQGLRIASGVHRSTDTLYQFVIEPTATPAHLAKNFRLPQANALPMAKDEELYSGGAVPSLTSVATVKLPTVDQQTYAAATVALEVMQGWRVAYFTPLQEFSQPADTLARNTQWAAFFTGLAVIILSWLLARSLTRPLARLTHTAERIAAGDLDARVNMSTSGEVGILAESFDSMATHLMSRNLELQRIQNQLEDRVHSRTRALDDANRQLRAEIDERERIEAEREALNRRLLKTAHRAGMSEMATNVLHNVGNVLTSINTASSLLEERVRESAVRMLKRTAELLTEQGDEVHTFLATDQRGRQVPKFLIRLADKLEREHELTLSSIKGILRDIDHIRAIITVQQNGAIQRNQRIAPESLTSIVDDAIRINQAGLRKARVTIERQYQDLRSIAIDRHKLMQILVNIVANAKDAMKRSGGDRRLTVTIADSDVDSVRISVTDTGVGIAHDKLDAIFEWGYTGRADGHGFGLHSSLLAAQELGGSLSAQSEGAGCGATFVLTLPKQPPPGAARAQSQSSAYQPQEPRSL